MHKGHAIIIGDKGHAIIMHKKALAEFYVENQLCDKTKVVRKKIVAPVNVVTQQLTIFCICFQNVGIFLHSINRNEKV